MQVSNEYKEHLVTVVEQQGKGNCGHVEIMAGTKLNKLIFNLVCDTVLEP